MEKSKNKKIGKQKPNELGLTGPGAEPLVIAEIDAAADTYADSKEALDSAKDRNAMDRIALLAAMHEHRDKLISDGAGGLSYHYEEKVVVLKPSSEKVTVKSVHNDVADEDNN